MYVCHFTDISETGMNGDQYQGHCFKSKTKQVLLIELRYWSFKCGWIMSERNLGFDLKLCQYHLYKKVKKKKQQFLNNLD